MDWNKAKVYAVKHKNLETRLKSRSGGIFTALSDIVLNESGIVYGCVLTEKFEAVHVRAETTYERNFMRGSKYIQSNLGDIFSAVKQDLLDNKKVLFSGTSCQISGLKSYLEVDFNNLICVDIVCHGVPSPDVWVEYLKWQENKLNGHCVSVDFRNKIDFGWDKHIETLKIIDDKGNLHKVNSEVFKTIYYGHCILRPCCYSCPYKSTMHPGDITIADYWGIEKAAPGFNDNKGVSLVLINNEKGFKYFNQVSGDIIYCECRIEDSMRPSLEKPFDIPKLRSQFWVDFNNASFDKIAKKYGGLSWKNKIRKLIRSIK